MVVGDCYETRDQAKSKWYLASFLGTRKAQGWALELRWEKATKSDRLLDDFCYVDDGVILGVGA